MPSTMVWSTPFFTMYGSNGVPVMIDWPTIAWSQATMSPLASRPISALCTCEGR